MKGSGEAVQEAIFWKLDPTEIGPLLVVVPYGENPLVFVSCASFSLAGIMY